MWLIINIILILVIIAMFAYPYINKFRISTKNIRNILIENVQIAIVDTIDEAALQVLYRLKRLK